MASNGASPWSQRCRGPRREHRLQSPQTTAMSASRMVLPADFALPMLLGCGRHCKSSVEPQSVQNGCNRRARLDSRCPGGVVAAGVSGRLGVDGVLGATRPSRRVDRR